MGRFRFWIAMDKLNCGQGIGSEWKFHRDGLVQHLGSRDISQITRVGDLSDGIWIIQ
jgi:hypothetical protein